MSAQTWITYLPWLWVMRWNNKASEFFCEYIKFPQRAYTVAGNLTPPAMRQGAKYLLQERVFISIADMRAQALQDFGVILPDGIFKHCNF